MGDIDRKASVAAQYIDQPKWLKRSFILALLVLGLAILILGLRSAPRAAYAQGVVQITIQGEELHIVISQVSSDDPPEHNDPGLAIDVAECRQKVKQGKRVNIIINNGYPGYACTLHFTVHNRSPQPVRLQETQISAAPGLEVVAVNPSGTQLVPAGEESQQVYLIRIQAQAAEQAQLEFQILEIYAPIQANLTTR